MTEGLQKRPKDPAMVFGISFLVVISTVVLNSTAPTIFPLYFIFLVLGYIFYFLFLQVDFDILKAFSNHVYAASIILLILPLIIGQVTRGAIRWIPIGDLTIQPSEIVRPFLLIFLATYLTKQELDVKRALKGVVLIAIPVFLILIQPSFGVAVLTLVGFVGVLLALSIKKKYLLFTALSALLLTPAFWFLLAPYQKERIVSFINPYTDPQGSGYNSIQAMISVGSGRLIGRGLGEGVQTQLAFLPERHTDFIFASTAEELGFVGSGLLILGLFIIFWRLVNIVEHPKDLTARAYSSGLFFSLFFQSAIHIGMNMGLFPITGVPLPLVSAGGSAYLATMIGLAISVNAKNLDRT